MEEDVMTTIGLQSTDAGVQCIQVKEPVPEQFAELGSLDAWRLMARHGAFDILLQKISPMETFTVQFCLSEEWGPNPAGTGRRLMIICDLIYRIEVHHEG
jgi:hypothetical protein